MFSSEKRTTSFGIDDILGDNFGKRKLFEYEDLSDEGDLSEHIRSDSNDSAIFTASEGSSKNSDKGKRRIPQAFESCLLRFCEQALKSI